MLPSEYDAQKAKKARKAAQPTYAWIRPVSSSYSTLLVCDCESLLLLCSSFVLEILLQPVVHGSCPLPVSLCLCLGLEILSGKDLPWDSIWTG